MNLDEHKFAYDFTNRTILVTGGAGVLGGEIACALAGCNANIVLLDRNQDLAQEVVKRFPQEVNGRAVRVYGDVLKTETLLQANEIIKAEFGAVDILINAAGGNHPSATTSANLSFFDLPLDTLRHVGDLNLLGTVVLATWLSAQVGEVNRLKKPGGRANLPRQALLLNIFENKQIN